MNDMEATIKLANSSMPTGTWRPQWLRADATYGESELGWCMEHNPGPFAFGDIKKVKVLHTSAEPPFDSMGEYEWKWRVTLRDGRKFMVEGWHDFTGWDCQSGAEYTEIKP